MRLYNLKKSSLKYQQIYLQLVRITRDDDDDIIARMFTRMNTKCVSLKDGELLKAHDWRKNIPIVQLSKKTSWWALGAK